jgi:nanoRNase/pAp phosphatase (c-di-AMP/oligoRNAs hydrolase)
MSTLVIHHGNCQDGFTAAWCAWRRFGDDAEYLPANYGAAEPPDVTGRDVVILDFSYKRDVLLEMAGKAKSLRVLDHHKTAEADLAGLDFCLFDMNRSGAGIAWDELVALPYRSRLVNYVEDRDLWRFKLPQSKQINAYIGTFQQSFETWDRLDDALESNFEGCAEIGQAILNGVDKYVVAMAEQCRRVTLAGYDVPCVNAPYLNISELVGHLAANTDAPFAVGWFQRGDGRYQYSLRSRGDFDVSLVAQQFGGGGHKGAAGFSVDARVDA